MPETMYVVEPAAVARRVGIDPTELSGDVLIEVVDAIRDAEAEVAGYLNRDILPTTHSETVAAAPYTLSRPVLRVLAEEPVDGGLRVTYLSGDFDARDHPDVVRYVRHAAVAQLGHLVPRGRRVVTSESVEGQSVSYARERDARDAKRGEAGAAPTLESLSRHRRGARTVLARTRTPGAGRW